MKALPFAGLLLLTSCAEESEGEASLEMQGFGIPLPLIALVVLGVVLLLRRRR